MIQLLMTDLFRVLKDKRLFIVAAFHFCMFTLTLSGMFASIGVTYTGSGNTLGYFMERYSYDSESEILASYMATVDIFIATFVYAAFFFTDGKRDKAFENMCTIYRNRIKVVFAEYITLCFVGLFFTLSKLLGVTVMNLAFGYKVVFCEGKFNYFGIFMWFIILAAYMAVFYTIYMLTRNIYVPLVLLFAPVTISFCSRFMTEVPFGDKIFLGSLLFLEGPTLAYYELDDRLLGYKILLLCVAVIAVLLTATSVVITKRDVK
ncbi:MAG: hypothetical protein K6F49_09200 [Saccharofermentans sp.]|nr:hypothetical protein [Saccharofermentans sp.]